MANINVWQSVECHRKSLYIYFHIILYILDSALDSAARRKLPRVSGAMKESVLQLYLYIGNRTLSRLSLAPAESSYGTHCTCARRCSRRRAGDCIATRARAHCSLSPYLPFSPFRGLDYRLEYNWYPVCVCARRSVPRYLLGSLVMRAWIARKWAFFKKRESERDVLCNGQTLNECVCSARLFEGKGAVIIMHALRTRWEMCESFSSALM